MPQESGYSDDVNFMNTEKASLEAILPIAKEVFQEFNLFINTEKTEFTHVYLAPVGEKVPDRDDTLDVETRNGGRIRSLGHCCVLKVT